MTLKLAKRAFKKLLKPKHCVCKLKHTLEWEALVPGGVRRWQCSGCGRVRKP